MRRTVLSALALGCTAVLASTVPAFADDATPSPVPTRVSESASQAPSAEPTRAPSAEPTTAPAPGEVSRVPEGAPDTGVAPAQSGTDGALIGGGAAAVFAAGGAAVYLVRRRRATGA
ncbi:Tat pathway signal sequence domain protein [Streptomyces sp. NBC_00038]|uniref:Tat pathway signal sequence domain protein n=1 Tax=Streptomyces sp. NBC_00038 TaxID=2903615 RepID=UPI00225A10F4|nr:Tat pathway signal sequence domain protein [Streptomyces sp. NBC_00038]MCX5561171.1 Tat pathway signal sequence domain protein [Streptomyces sp. NBC_00038]